MLLQKFEVQNTRNSLIMSFIPATLRGEVIHYRHLCCPCKTSYLQKPVSLISCFLRIVTITPHELISTIHVQSAQHSQHDKLKKSSTTFSYRYHPHQFACVAFTSALWIVHARPSGCIQNNKGARAQSCCCKVFLFLYPIVMISDRFHGTEIGKTL